MSDRAPRQKRARLWAGLYVALFGSEDDEQDGDPEQSRAHDLESTTGGDDG